MFSWVRFWRNGEEGWEIGKDDDDDEGKFDGYCFWADGVEIEVVRKVGKGKIGGAEGVG